MAGNPFGPYDVLSTESSVIVAFAGSVIVSAPAPAVQPPTGVLVFAAVMASRNLHPPAAPTPPETSVTVITDAVSVATTASFAWRASLNERAASSHWLMRQWLRRSRIPPLKTQSPAGET